MKPADAYLPVRFINHACISISPDVDGEILLTDPWFQGEVFNRSWNLLVDTDWSLIDWQRVRHIWISHEHPDHLNFPTLKEIRARVSGPVNIFFRAQKNKNVRDALSKMGFDVVELEPEAEARVSERLSITTYWNGQDTAAVFRCGELVIVNQNDCQLKARLVSKIMRKFGHVDLLLFQFSLAGYYANEDDAQGLRRAGRNHLAMIERYVALFRPRMYVPFASFVYFCKTSNRFLNEWAVRLQDVAALPALAGRLQLCIPGDAINIEAPAGADKTAAKLAYWNKQIAAEREYHAPRPVPAADIVDAGQRFIAEVARISFKFMRPIKTAYLLQDTRQYLLLDYKNQHCRITDMPDSYALAGSLPAEEAFFFLNFPWGADTLNITSSFYVHDHFAWRWSLYLKHLLYVVRSTTLRYLISPLAFAFAAMRSLMAARRK